MMNQWPDLPAGISDDPMCGAPGDFALMQLLNAHVLRFIKTRSENMSVPSSYQPGSIEKPASSWVTLDPSELQALLLEPVIAAYLLAKQVPFSLSYTDTPPAVKQALASSDVEMCGARVSLNALEFCAEHRIVRDLTFGLERARHWFLNASNMRAYLERDPEDLDEYVVLEVTSTGESAADLDAYSKFSEDWSKSVEWPASRMILLDLISSSPHSKP
jgi:hypothetical protein